MNTLLWKVTVTFVLLLISHPLLINSSGSAAASSDSSLAEEVYSLACKKGHDKYCKTNFGSEYCCA